jgi:hypothetical protein
MGAMAMAQQAPMVVRFSTLTVDAPLRAISFKLLTLIFVAPGPPLSPNSERRNYNLAPPPLGGNGAKGESDDRLQDLIHQLTKPKEPKLQRRLTWKCVGPRSLQAHSDAYPLCRTATAPSPSSALRNRHHTSKAPKRQTPESSNVTSLENTSGVKRKLVSRPLEVQLLLQLRAPPRHRIEE